MALRNLAVEINSIVRVILRMLRIDLRRRSSAGLAMVCYFFPAQKIF